MIEAPEYKEVKHTLINIAPGIFEANTPLIIQDITIAGIKIELGPIGLMPGQRFIIEWEGLTSPVTLAIQTLD